MLDRDRLGHYRTGGDAQFVQSLAIGFDGSFGAPAYWNGHLYYIFRGGGLHQFALQNGKLSPEAVVQGVFNRTGATPAISANGSIDGIVWAIESPQTGQQDFARLHAYDANDISKELFASDWNTPRERTGLAVHFAIPTIANGRVYVGAQTDVDVYGLLPLETQRTPKPSHTGTAITKRHQISGGRRLVSM